MPTPVLTNARRRIAEFGLADRVLLDLVEGRRPGDRNDLTDDNAAAVWVAVALRLQGYRNGAFARRADVGLADLHVRLTGLLSRVRAAGVGDLSAEVGRYREIRGAQQALMTAYVRNGVEVEVPSIPLRVPAATLMRVAGAVRNLDQLWPDWRQQQRGNGYGPPPWQFDEAEPFSILPSAANLRWLAAGPADPWVPTVEQAARAVAEQMQAEELRFMGLKKPAGHGDTVSVPGF